jgi:hypothetical protein
MAQGEIPVDFRRRSGGPKDGGEEAVGFLLARERLELPGSVE